VINPATAVPSSLRLRVVWAVAGAVLLATAVLVLAPLGAHGRPLTGTAHGATGETGTGGTGTEAPPHSGTAATPPFTPADTVYNSVAGGGIALTFDDGPDPVVTPMVLEVLQRHHAKATFCMIGEKAKRYPLLVRQVVRAGMTVCNHTMYHDDALAKRTPARIADDLREASDLIEEAGGVRPVYFRTP
jgi:hypothetical protein